MSIDWTKPIVMKDGRPVRCLCSDRKLHHEERLTHVILINDPAQGEILASCDSDGVLFRSGYLPELCVVNADPAAIDWMDFIQKKANPNG